MSDQPKCEICGEPMPPGEEMFKFHGYSGNCPKPPLKRREITTHKINGCNESIKIEVMDEPGHGGACHEYCLSIPGKQSCIIKFQNGPIKEAGTNGITHEALLAVLIDRLQGFQSGSYECAENAEALQHCQAAMEALHRRTKARLARGVEGTHTV